MRSRWFLALFCLVSLLYAQAAHASRHRDLPTSSGGTVDDCGSGAFTNMFLSYQYVSSVGFGYSPVVQLAPIAVNDSKGNLLYTVHIDAYDMGTVGGCGARDYPSLPPLSEVRTTDTYTLLYVYVIGSDGKTYAPVALSSLELTAPLVNPSFFNCYFGIDSGWQLCNTPIDGNEGALSSYSSYSMQPSPSPGAEGNSTVFTFGNALDLGGGSGITSPTPVALNSPDPNVYQFPVFINGAVSYVTIGPGSAVLEVDGTVLCDTPIDGFCNNLSPSTPYSLTFIDPNTSSLLTASSPNFPAPVTKISAAGHDTSANPILVTSSSSRMVYDVSANNPQLVNGAPTAAGTVSCQDDEDNPLQAYRSVWFQYTPPVNTQLYISTAASHYDTILSVAGSSPVQLCNDDFDQDGTGTVTSQLTLPVTQGVPYQIEVTEYPPDTEMLNVGEANTPDKFVAPLSSDSTLYFTLTTPQLHLSPASVNNFGNGIVGQASAAQTILISSKTSYFGGGGITGITASTTGDFQVSPTSCPTPLPDSGPACTLSITFSPTAKGARSGTLTIASSGSMAAENAPIAINLSGTGQFPTPAVSLSPATSLTFPSQGVNTSSSFYNVVVSNSGTGPLTVSSVATTGDFHQTNNCTSGQVPVSSQCTVMVTFSPTAAGTRSGLLTITDNAASTTQKLSLSGLGIGTPVISWSNPAPIVYGTPLSGTQLNAKPSVPGTFTYTPSAGTILTAGAHTLSAFFMPTDTVDYTTATATVPVTVTQAKAIVTWVTPAAIVYGAKLTATQLNATSSLPGKLTYSPALGALLTAGTHPLLVTFTPTDAANDAPVTATVNLSVTRATPVVTWKQPAPIVYGAALSATQLNASASAQGSFAYSPAFGSILTAGSHVVTAVFTPTDGTDYNKVTTNLTIVVNQVKPTIAWAAPAAIPYGTMLSSTQLGANPSVTGTVSYLPVAGTILPAGVQTLSATLTPKDSLNYATVTVTVNITVNRVTPTIAWNTPASIVYGTPLSSTQLNPVPSVPGGFIYSPVSGTVLAGGSHTLSATFTPTDVADYNKATATTSITVTPATPTIVWPTPAAITAGTKLSATQLNAKASLSGATVSGTYTYTPALGTVLPAGSNTLSVAFTPSNTANYTAASATVTLVVNPAP